MILVPSSRVKKSKKKPYLKTLTYTMLRVREFQPAQSAQITEMCDERL
jgi:hypothetical protein